MKKIRQSDQSRKMSDIMKEMLEILLRNPKAVPSSEASHVALFFAKWETQLYGMVRGGYKDEAIRFLKETRKMSENEATMEVAKIGKQLGMV